MKEAGFATYDHSQTWTEPLLAAEWHVLNTWSKLIYNLEKSDCSCQMQEENYAHGLCAGPQRF